MYKNNIEHRWNSFQNHEIFWRFYHDEVETDNADILKQKKIHIL